MAPPGGWMAGAQPQHFLLYIQNRPFKQVILGARLLYERVCPSVTHTLSN